MRTYCGAGKPKRNICQTAAVSFARGCRALARCTSDGAIPSFGQAHSRSLCLCNESKKGRRLAATPSLYPQRTLRKLPTGSHSLPAKAGIRAGPVPPEPVRGAPLGSLVIGTVRRDQNFDAAILLVGLGIGGPFGLAHRDH